MGQTWDENGNVITAPSQSASAKTWDENGNPVTNAAGTASASPQNDTGVWAGIKRNTAGMIAGIYHAFADPATDEEKAAIKAKAEKELGPIKENDVGGKIARQLLAEDPSRIHLAYHRLVDAPASELMEKGTNQVEAAKDLLSRGDVLHGVDQYLDGRLHQGLAQIPMAGPWINSVTNRARAGDISGAATDIAFAVAMENAPEATKAVKKNVLNAPLIDSVRDSMAQQIAGPIVRKTPSATMNDLKFGRSPADAITKEPGLEGVTVSGLRDGVVKRMNEIGQAMDQHLQAAAPNAQPINVEPIIDKAYQDAISSPMAKLNQGLTNRLYDQANALKTKFGGLQKDPFEATQFKREVGQATKWTGQPFDNEANQMLVDVYRGVKDEVNNAVPEVKDLNERYADLLSAKTALDRRIAFDANRPWSIGRSMLGAGGGALGTIAGGAVGGAPGAALGTVVDVLRSEPSRIAFGKAIGAKYAPVSGPAAPAAAIASPAVVSPITGAPLATPAQLFKGIPTFRNPVTGKLEPLYDPLNTPPAPGQGSALKNPKSFEEGYK